MSFERITCTPSRKQVVIRTWVWLTRSNCGPRQRRLLPRYRNSCGVLKNERSNSAAKCDTPERRDSSKRLTYGISIQNKKLKGVLLAADGQFWRHDPEAGMVRVIPKHVVLLTTDTDGREDVLGFFYPAKEGKSNR